MAFQMPEAAIQQLKGFIQLCKAQPQIIHKPELKFFKDYLESMGATLPQSPATPPPEETPKAESNEKQDPPPQPQTKQESEVPTLYSATARFTVPGGQNSLALFFDDTKIDT